MCNQGKLTARARGTVQFVVDCSLQMLDGTRALVLPRSACQHVHERIIRCRACRYCKSHDTGWICTFRPVHHFWTKPDDFCSHARPKGR